MQAEQSSLTSADWAALPADILHLVFSHVLAPPAAPAAAGLPLLPLVRRWFALASTCKHWRDALGSVPLAVELSAAPAACLAWLAAQPVRRLHIASSPDASLAAAEEQLVLHQGMMIEQAAEAVHDCGINQMMSLPDNDRSRLAYQRERCISRDPQASAMFPWLAAAAGQTVSLDSMMSELEGVMDEVSPTQQAPAKTWSLAAWHSLESLHLEGPNNWHGDLSFFAAASLADLPRLHSLSLACFYGYDLRGLPTSLRRLRLHYEPFLPDQMAFQSMCYSFSLLELPESARLDQLVVEKSEGAVAFEWAPLSRRCRRLMLHGGLGRSAAILSSPRQVLIGVPLPPSEAALWDALHPEAVFVSDGQRIDGRRAATAAWLEDFAHSADCLLSELCLGCRLEDAHDLLQLVPLAPSGPSGGDPGGDTAPLSGGSSGGSSGAGQPRHNSEGTLEGAAKQLHAYHMLAVHRPPSWGEPHTEYFPAVDAAPALREAAATQPFCLICLERSPPELHTLPGLLSLVRQAVADAPPDVN